MKMLRISGAVLMALLIAYLLFCNSRPKNLNGHEDNDATEEQAGVVMRPGGGTGH